MSYNERSYFFKTTILKLDWISLKKENNSCGNRMNHKIDVIICRYNNHLACEHLSCPKDCPDVQEKIPPLSQGYQQTSSPALAPMY